MNVVTVLVVLGLVGFGVWRRQPPRYWASALVALALHFAVGALLGPSSAMYRGARADADATADPDGALFVGVLGVALGWVAPALVVAYGAKRHIR